MLAHSFLSSYVASAQTATFNKAEQQSPETAGKKTKQNILFTLRDNELTFSKAYSWIEAMQGLELYFQWLVL